MSDQDLVWHPTSIGSADRVARRGHKGALVWLTGLSASGKSTIAHATEARLFEQGCSTFVLDGDNIRHGLCSDLGFSDEDREENIRRIGHVGKLFVEAAVITFAALISPFIEDRNRVRELMGSLDFIEVYCKCPLQICEDRDPKGIYRRARAGDVQDFTGISAVYQEPLNPDISLATSELSVEESVDVIVSCLRRRGVI